ncbi:MAG: isoleucine--tRNA ligase [Pseudomonadota bacterium]|nr:isoleucine--tRNA ligase [Pseudomonadota bacterium]
MVFSFPDNEQNILKFWQENDIFKQSLELRSKAPKYIFYDGPPFATGLPHHGHLLASTLKDIIPRYKTMQGYYVERRFGWDCHGLPIEHEIDKQYGKTTHELVAEIGIDGYNQACRDVVMRFSSQWRQTIERLGRWVDFDNDYKTMDTGFMESVWWVFSELWQQDLIYRGTKVVPFSTSLGTVLSNFEASSNYMDVQDPSIIVLFQMKDKDYYLAAWTTTPWTLPANLGICVGPDVKYVKVRDNEKQINIVVAAERLPILEKKHDLTFVCEISTEELIGSSYEPLFPYYSDYQDAGAFRVFSADFVTTENGTGVVHAAPAFGEDDFNTLQAAGMLEMALPIDNNGKFKAEVEAYAGQYIKDADKNILKDLKAEGLIYEHDTFVHSYPFCPRSDTPLIYMAIPSWYVRVEKIKDRLISANENINWIPEHIKYGRFGKWLEGARDWAISRNRVWGTPLPIWQNDVTGNYICIGSIAELENYSGLENIVDLHRDVVDNISFSLPNEQGTYKRISEVLDCWFESGSMPYAQKHYPFKDKVDFESNFPAEFIAEGLDQTRGWFYTLNVLSVALFDKMAFKNVIVNGIIAAEDGKKMSKRLKNYTPPDELFEKYGADALRLYMINSGLVKAQEQRFRDAGVMEVVRQTLLPYHNSFKFFSTYAKVDAWKYCDESKETTNIVDLWLKSRCHSLITMINEHMDNYKLYVVVPEILSFIDDLTNIYIRLNRQRFWQDGMPTDKIAAYSTLYKSLLDFSKCLAPFAPFISEHIYQELTKFNSAEMPQSVHLCSYPTANAELIDSGLELGVELMQQIIVLGRQQRNDKKIKVKIPLRKILVIHRDKSVLQEVRKLESYILAELNVKEVEYTDAESEWVDYDIKPYSPVLGKRLGKRFGHFRKLISQIDLAQIEELEKTGKLELDNELFSESDILLYRKAKLGTDVVSSPKIAIMLDLELDKELLVEGLAREVVNRIQKTRKDLDFNVDDRINITYAASGDLHEAIVTHSKYIAQETLAISLKKDDELSAGFTYEIDDLQLKLFLSKD